MAAWLPLQVVLLLGTSSAALAGTEVLSGDHSIWDSIFASRKVEEVVTIPAPSWPEGPQVWSGGILFSDTIKNRMYRYDRRFGVRVFLDNSGSPLPSALEWMAEPGSNGIAVDPERRDVAYVCQHGQHAISKLDLQSKEIRPIATHFEGKRLNGPNDLTVDPGADFLYFTDPIYAYLRKDAFYDAAYVDEACNGNLGFKGVYRLSLGGPPWELSVVDRHRNPRPNGIALSPDGSHLYVGNCCQGDHLPNCTQGTVNYNIYKLGRTPEHPARFVRAVTFTVDGGSGRRGCADGFKVHRDTGYIVGSCASGICVVGTGVPPVPKQAAREVLPKAAGRRLLALQHASEPPLEEEDEELVEEEMVVVVEQEGSGNTSEGPTASNTPGPALSRSGGFTGKSAAAAEALDSDALDSADSTAKPPADEYAEAALGGGGSTGRSAAAAAAEAVDSHPPGHAVRDNSAGKGGPRKKSAAAAAEADATGRAIGEKLVGKVGLLARLELRHKVSNVVFGDDGFLYATGESRSGGGGGALLRIPLRQRPVGLSPEEMHDELR
mmetsp:Transcript_14236/g.40338  ORF Transcript_14236/g.40338 Transcript_14236/m.40338 type:complete len:550 (-) Transcript_14236:211-1860(-)